jgi:hypothetical protein
MKIKYTGDEFTEVFGLSWKPGETLDVSDEYASEKLRFNPRFEAAETKDRPKKGEAPKTGVPSDALAVTRERITEAVNRQIIADIERKKREG